MKRILIAATFGVTALGVAAPASAQFARSQSRAAAAYADVRASYIEARRAAYDNGYREGLKEGQKEGRQRDEFGYRDERTYQRADKGYHRELGDRERYRQSFRAGYADGYAEAYRRTASRRGGVGAGNGRYSDGRYGQGGYGGYGGYGQGGYRQGGYGYSVAFQYGLDDGYEKGLEDVRKRRSHDILRHSWYRSGDRHYNSRYGSRQQYADMYRRGFREGYERGFREGRYR